VKSSAQPPLDLHGTGYCAAFNFRRTARAVTKLYDEALQPAGMRSTQFAILVGVKKNEPVAIGRLGQLLGIDSTTLTRSLRLLRREGLLAVGKRAERRQRFVSVTPKGARRFVDTVGDEYWQNLRSELERLAGVATKLEVPG